MNVEFIEVKNNLERGGIEMISDILSDRVDVDVWIIEAIYSIYKAINGEKHLDFNQARLDEINEYISDLVNKSLEANFTEGQINSILSLCELVDNWCSLYGVECHNVMREINLLNVILSASSTIMDQISLLKILNKKIHSVLLHEPIETRVSEMYRGKLEEYFNSINHGEYNV